MVEVLFVNSVYSIQIVQVAHLTGKTIKLGDEQSTLFGIADECFGTATGGY